MTLQEAIFINTDSVSYFLMKEYGQRADALRMGIEALKRIQDIRLSAMVCEEAPLPGETPAKPLYALGFNTGDDESP